MDNSLPVGMNSDPGFYSLHFMDLATWEPCVRQVCQRYGLRPVDICPGVPGTFPTFMVELQPGIPTKLKKSVVVKFFGPLFDGASSFLIEKVIGCWLAHQTLPIQSPGIILDGWLDPDWSYLVFEKVDGMSIHQVGQPLSAQAWLGVAKKMGIFIKALHSTTASSLPGIAMPIPARDWSGYIEFLECQLASCTANHWQWGDLPPQLLPQVQDYLLPVDELIDLSSPPHLIHADLTGDHLLGRLVPERKIGAGSPVAPHSRGAGWESLAVIDWGDTRIGNILYELVALHLDLFKADARLLNACLETYELPDFYKHDFARKAFCMVLLHQFPMPASVYKPHAGVQSLDELAVRLFTPQAE
jgi:hypothetical protein